MGHHTIDHLEEREREGTGGDQGSKRWDITPSITRRRENGKVSAGTKVPRRGTSHHRSPGGERAGRYWWERRFQVVGHHTIDHLVERGLKRGTARRFSLTRRETAVVSQTNIGTVSKATLGKTLERRVGAHTGFLERVHTILN